jgi:hypothetical protein
MTSVTAPASIQIVARDCRTTTSRIGLRWHANDLSDTQALVGVIWDVESSEYVFSLEASRRLGETWGLYLESRVFGGGDDDPVSDPFNPAFKTATLQRDDYVQFELTKYF